RDLEVATRGFAREGFKRLALVEHEAGILPWAHTHHEEHPVVAAGPEPGEIEIEPGEVIGLIELELQLFVELSVERLQRLLARIHRATKATPMIRVPDIWSVVTMLENVRTVVEDDESGNGIGSGEAGARIGR